MIFLLCTLSRSQIENVSHSGEERKIGFPFHPKSSHVLRLRLADKFRKRRIIRVLRIRVETRDVLPSIVTHDRILYHTICLS